MKKYFLMVFLSILIGCNSSILDDPAAVIPFSVPEPAHVKVTVENSYNTIIAILVDDDLPAGTFSAQLDISSLAEGMYFYIIEIKPESGSQIKMTKHMLLVK